MSLSCECGDDAEWWYEPADGVAPLATKRWRACCSCKDRINVGDDCKALRRWRAVCDFSDPPVVISIYGDEYPLTTWYLCDRCAGLYESLSDLGFCITMPDNLIEVCREYAQMQRDAGVFRGQMAVQPASKDPR